MGSKIIMISSNTRHLSLKYSDFIKLTKIRINKITNKSRPVQGGVCHSGPSLSKHKKDGKRRKREMSR
jgi:hypothetical protein